MMSIYFLFLLALSCLFYFIFQVRSRLIKPLILSLALLTLMACAQKQVLEPQPIQAQILAAWQQDWHGVWALTWDQAPIADPIIFEAWQAGPKRRYEILEASAPDLVGLVYVSDGQFALHYNRLKPGTKTQQARNQLPFGPISQAFDFVTTLLNRLPQSVEQRGAAQPDHPIAVYVFYYAQDETLTLWFDEHNKRLIKLHHQDRHRTFTLTARSLEALPDPHPRLFQIDSEQLTSDS